MTEPSPITTNLPASIASGLERLTPAVRDALGPELVALILYGSVVRGDFDEANSDVNVLLVVKEASLGVLDQVRVPLRQAARDIRLEPLVLTAADVARSAELFPLRSRDMQRFHRLLAGRDVLAGVEVSPERLRLRCEQVIETKLFRLRRTYLQKANLPDALTDALVTSIPRLLGAIGVLIELRQGISLVGRDEIVDAAEELGLDVAPIRKVLAVRRHEVRLGTSAVAGLYDAFLRRVEQVANMVRRA